MAYFREGQKHNSSIQSSFPHHSCSPDGSGDAGGLGNADGLGNAGGFGDASGPMRAGSQTAIDPAAAPDASLTAPDSAAMESAAEQTKVLVQCWGSGLAGKCSVYQQTAHLELSIYAQA